MLNQVCGYWGTSFIGITNLDLIYTTVVGYRTSIFMMRKISSNKFNLDIFQYKYFAKTIPVTSLELKYAVDNIEDATENCVSCASKDGSVNFSEQCLPSITHKA